MKNLIWYRIGTWNLKVFFSISLGFHLLFFATGALLFPDFKIDRIPPLNIEVSLVSVGAQEKSVSAPIPATQVKAQTKKEEKKPLSPLPAQKEMKVIPVDDSPMEGVKSEINNKVEEKVEKELVLQAKNISWGPETVVTFQGDKGSESEDPALPTFSSLEESEAAKGPSLSERGIAFIQPKYAENPKPTYPQEARKKGYQGEVILKVEVLSNGRVGQVEVKRSSGHEILDRSAFAAVKEWRFVPAKKGENPISFWVNIPIKFQLQ
jgi:protein TonB